MNNLVLLIFCLLSGLVFSRSARMPQNLPAAFNSFIIHISLPSLTLLYVHELKVSSDLILVAAMPWLHFGFAAAFFIFLGKRIGLDGKTIGALILTAGMGNTSFFGLPMIEAFFGKEGIVYGIIVDQLGSFLVLSIFGISVAAAYGGGSATCFQIFKKIVTFPPFITLILALLLMPFTYPEWLIVLLKRLGDTLVPLALFSVGFQFHPGHINGNEWNLALGLGFKLVLAPLLLFLLYAPIIGTEQLPIQVTLFEAAMPPMITAGIVAAEHDLNPPLANLMVTLGLALSFITLSIWWLILRGNS